MSIAYWQMHDMGDGSWALMSLGGILVWGLIIWAVISLIRARGAQSAPETAREILDRRLAMGEISTDEYERRRDALRPSSGPTTARP